MKTSSFREIELADRPLPSGSIDTGREKLLADGIDRLTERIADGSLTS